MPSAERHPIRFQVSRPDHNFTGRSPELGVLRSTLVKEPHIVLVTGMGGVGKTQLVRKYISENEKSYENFIWINSEKHELIEEAFRTLAKTRLHIKTSDANGQEKDLASILELVFSKLSTASTLIVYDNADNKECIQFLLTIETAGSMPHVVITSRIQEWSADIQKIRLNVWESDEAYEYVSKTLSESEAFSDDKRLLAKKLQNFPLALRQATAHISYQRQHNVFHIADYIKKYDTQKMLDSKYFQLDVLNKYEKTTFTTWRITIIAIQEVETIGPLADKILRIISFFDRENIHRDMFFHHRLLNERSMSEYEENVKLAFRLLINYSMIDSQSHLEMPQSILSIHKLIQKVIKIELRNNNEEEPTLRDGLLIFSKMLAKANIDKCYLHAVSVFLSAVKFEELVREFKEMPANILECLNTKGKYRLGIEFGNRILPTFRTAFIDRDPNLLTTKNGIANSFLKQGMSAKATLLFKEVYDQREKLFGPNHDLTLESQNGIATAYAFSGHYAEAMQIYLDIREKKKVSLKADLEDPLLINNIASMLVQSGKCSEALPLYQVIFETQRIFSGEADPIALTAKHNLAICYRSLDKHSEALQTFQEVLEERRKVLDENHPDLLDTQSNITICFISMERYAEALSVQQEVFEKQKAALGEYHPNTLKSRTDLAGLYTYIGNHSAALELWKDIYEKQKKTLRENHPEMIATRQNMAISLKHLGDSTGALEILRDILPHATDKQVLVVKSTMASTLAQMNKFSDALQLYLDIYDEQNRISTPDDPYTLDTQLNIASSYAHLGNWNEALRIFSDVSEKRKRIYGENSVEMFKTQFIIANSYETMGKYVESQQMLLKLFAKQKNILGIDHPSTLKTEYGIAILYELLENHCEALQAYEALNEKQKNALGENHPYTISAQEKMAHLYTDVGQHMNALQMHQQIFQKLTSLHGSDHPNTHESHHYLALAYTTLEKYTDALREYKELFEKDMSTHGNYHPMTLTSQLGMANAYSKLGNHVEALQTYQNLHKKQKISLREDDADVLACQFNIATSLSQLDRHTEALGVYQDVFDQQRRFLGEDHKDTLSSLHNLATSYSRLGKHTEALEMFKRRFDKLKQNLSRNHPDVLTSQFYVATTYMLMGKKTEALPIYLEVFNGRKISLGETHPLTLQCQHNVAALYSEQQDRLDDALQLFTDVHKKMKCVLGENHEDTIQCQRSIDVLNRLLMIKNIQSVKI